MARFTESKWPKDLAIEIVKGNGEAKLAVFEDPNCGYCQMFDQQTLTQMDNVTIYVFLWPFLGEDSVAKAEAILGSDDPAQAFLLWMDEQVIPDGEPTQEGKETLEKIFRLAEQLGIQGTPAIFTSNGHGPYGAMSAEQLAEVLSREP